MNGQTQSQTDKQTNRLLNGAQQSVVWTVSLSGCSGLIILIWRCPVGLSLGRDGETRAQDGLSCYQADWAQLPCALAISLQEKNKWEKLREEGEDMKGAMMSQMSRKMVFVIIVYTI